MNEGAPSNDTPRAAAVLGLLALALTGLSASSGQESPDVLAITHASVVPMDRERVLRDHTVLVREGRIVRVGPSGELDPPRGSQVLNADGRYLLPGLVDFHVHLRAEAELDAYLRHGVTTVVNMRGSPWHLALRDRIARGEVVGPRIYTAGPLIDGDPPIRTGSGTLVVSDRARAPSVVQDHLDRGYDLVKVYNNLRPEVLRAVVREAHAAGLPVAGHLPRRPVRTEGLQAGLDAGLDLIAHGEEVFWTEFGGATDSLLRQNRYRPPSDSALRDAARRIKAAGAAVTPNLSFIVMTDSMLTDLEAVFSGPHFKQLAPDVREMWRDQNPTRREDPELFAGRIEALYGVVRRLTRFLEQEGVVLLAGTDASAPGLYPGRSLHVELRELLRAGLSRYDALVAATRAPGDFLAEHVADAPRVGVVAEGRPADLLLVSGNPLEYISVLRRPERILVRGVWYNSE